MKNVFRVTFIVSYLVGFVSISFSDNEIELKNSFIEKYKNRAQITADCLIDKAHGQPNAPSKDGDLHAASRCSNEIQLPVVAEIMNAAGFSNAVSSIQQSQGTNQTISLRGAWRIWCEHAGDPQIQGEVLSPFNTTNPDHVFEIHPLIEVGGISLLQSLKPIEGFTTKDAYQAFMSYENKKSRIVTGANTTTIYTPMAGYNYVEFILQLYGNDQYVVNDGRFVYANVLDLNEDVIAFKRRMVFLKDSVAEQKVTDMKKGECLHVLGIPRIDLALVSWRSRNSGTRPDVLTWTLPYEIVIVGLYNDQVCQNQ